MIPMPGKIIVKQDGAKKERGGILVSERFAEKDRPMTGRVLAVGEGEPIRLGENTIMEMASEALQPRSAADSTSMRQRIASAIQRAVEQERQAKPVSVKAGDRVVFRVFAGDGIEWTDGSMCRCLTEDDILAKVIE